MFIRRVFLSITIAASIFGLSMHEAGLIGSSPTRDEIMNIKRTWPSRKTFNYPRGSLEEDANGQEQVLHNQFLVDNFVKRMRSGSVSKTHPSTSHSGSPGSSSSSFLSSSSLKSPPTSRVAATTTNREHRGTRQYDVPQIGM